MAGNAVYINRSGELVPPYPYIAQGVDFYGFVVKGDRGKLNQLCDRYLNDPIGQPARFVPALSHLLVVFNKIASLAWVDHPEFGWNVENEAAVWMVVFDSSLGELSWFHPYMFVDNDAALGCGREVYGFPKAFGWIDVATGGAPPTQLVARTSVVSATGQRVPAELLTIQQDPASGGAGFEALDKLEDLVKRIVEGILAGDGLLDLALLPLLSSFMSVPVPFLFLRQIRDSLNPAQAAIQLVQRTKPQASNISGARLFKSRYTLNAGQFASHPVRSDLGLPAAGPIPVNAAFWTKFDFRIGACEDISSP